MRDLVREDTGHFHAVRFYEDDESLCRLVVDFIGDGLVTGEPAVVIATLPHREAIVRGLEALSLDVPRLRERGELVVLDAEDTLSTFMNGGMPNPDVFAATVGAVLDRAQASRSKSRVRAYGEMVDWLWRHEAAGAAIRLEVLWNDLASTRAFSLLCSYAVGNFYKQGAYEQICAQHTHVVSGTGQPTRVSIS